jgi:hypothetical protein
MSADAQLFSDEELEQAVKQKDRHLLDRYLASRDVHAAVRAFYLQSVPGRTGKKLASTAENNLRLARAKLLYRKRMEAHGDVRRARAEMLAEFDMAEETAARLTEGRIPDVNRICAEISGSPDFKIGR